MQIATQNKILYYIILHVKKQTDCFNYLFLLYCLIHLALLGPGLKPLKQCSINIDSLGETLWSHYLQQCKPTNLHNFIFLN